MTLLWRHNGGECVSNHQPHDYFLNRVFRRRSKETSKLRVTGLCAGNSPGTGEFPAQRASYAEKFPFDDVIMSNWIMGIHRWLLSHPNNTMQNKTVYISFIYSMLIRVIDTLHRLTINAVNVLIKKWSIILTSNATGCKAWSQFVPK